MALATTIYKGRQAPIDEQRLMQNVFKIPTKSTRPDLKPSQAARTVVPARKSHRKSRTGCKTCKQRRIKCDENKDGGCLKCQSHGIECDYNSYRFPHHGKTILPKHEPINPPSTLLQSSKVGAIVNREGTRLLSPLNVVLVSPVQRMIELPNQMTPILQTLHHFDTVTYLSMGSELAQQVIRLCLRRTAMEKAYLLHAVNGVSAAHLCHLLPAAQYPKPHRQSKLAAAYHWREALRLFREELNGGGMKENVDTLISTVMLICVHQYMLNDSTPDPAQSFVYTSSDKREGCLQWLAIHQGFHVIWNELGDLVWQSIWCPVLKDADFKYIAPPFPDFHRKDKVYTLFLEFCDISEQSTARDNPYYIPLEYLLFFRQLEPCINNFTKLVTFVGHMGDRFQKLLLKRERRALLILAHWLAMMSELQQWWISGRSRAECCAIVTFLLHDRDERVKQLLAYPARTVGIVLL